MQKGYHLSSSTAFIFLRSTNVIACKSAMLKLPKRGGNLRVTACLPFTCTNHLVHGVGKWFAKLRTGKFRSRIACTICTNQFHLDGHEGLKLVSKTALKEWNTNFRLKYSIQKNRTTFSDVPVAPWNFPLGKPKESCSIYFPTRFPRKFL